MKRKGNFLSLESDAETVNQPIQGTPSVTPTADLLAKARVQIEADRRADSQIPADGSMPVSRVSQENGTGIGSNLLTIPELEDTHPASPQTTNVADDANNVGDPTKTGEAASNLPVTTGSQHGTAVNGPAYPASTTSTEALSPEDMAAVTQIAAAAVQTALASGQFGNPNTPNAAQAADEAAQAIATSPEGTTPAGPNAGPAGATPAEAARVVADLIKSNPDTVIDVVRAIDTVADAAMAATGEKPTEIAKAAENKATGNPPSDIGNTDDDIDEDEETEEELDDLDEERDDIEEEIDDVEDVEDDLEVATESLISRIRLVTALESAVEASLQNGGLSEDAANILQTVTDNMTEEDDMDDVDLGLESFAYRDRVLATHHIKNQLRYTREGLVDELKTFAGKFIDLFRTFARSTEVWLAATRRAVDLTRTLLVSKVDPLELPVPAGETFLDATEHTHTMLTYLLRDYYTYLYESSNTLTGTLQKIDTGLKVIEQPALAKKVADMRVKAPAIMQPNAGKTAFITEPMVSGRAIEVAFNGMNSYERIAKTPEMKRVMTTPQDMMTALDGLSSIMDTIEDYIRSEIDAMRNVRDVQGCLGFYDYTMRIWNPTMVGVPAPTQHTLEFDGKLVTFSEYVLFLVVEYQNALDCVRDAANVTRSYADYLLSNAKRFK